MLAASLPSRLVLASALLAGAALASWPVAPRAAPGADAAPAAAAAPTPVVIAAEEPAPSPLLGEMRFDAAVGRWTAPLGDARAILTLDPRLQAQLERELADWAVPYGAVVLLEPATGRVVALAEHSRAEPGRRGLALSAFAPAASVFKIVTGAALLEQGILPEEEVCYHGGYHRLQKSLLADDPRRDHACATLASAFGRSTNVVFAKLADRGLTPDLLRAEAERFLFNVPIPFVRPVEVSRAEIGDDPFAFSSAAAGFGPVRLSPLHGALLAAIVANRGMFVPPVLVDAADGIDLSPGEPQRIVDESIAEALGEMMRRTVSDGTAQHVFRRPPAPLRGVSVAGKTGSLADRSPYRDYSWFVGYAPADAPRVAVAAVVGNGTVWRVRAPTLARDALAAYFADRLVQAGGPGAVRTAQLERGERHGAVAP
ncbi:MAG TPA: penicillin-binding transpeptidase domain-containing protein [Anaeromyxobacteraceae bacterium]|nr:penicillin-binding transpeptidase domain-containing protein [Anaeromyxobacteraceae bacterium]